MPALTPRAATGTIRIGISACVLGQEVRYDGGHKLDRFVRDTFGAVAELVPVCPEVELGLGVPRETVRLVRPRRPNQAPRLIAPASGTDHTAAMLAYAGNRCDALAGQELCGFIAQERSPSCGLLRVKVYPAPTGGTATPNGRGLFTATLTQRFPGLPIEEGDRLHDPALRESFIVRVFAYRRLRNLFAAPWTAGDLAHFHAREKMLLLAHDRASHAALYRMMTHAPKVGRAQLRSDYTEGFLQALARHATPRKHVYVLEHMRGQLGKLLDDDDRAELREVIDSYRAGRVPLIVPMTLIRHHVRKHRVDELRDQSYLEPDPRELLLRNRV